MYKVSVPVTLSSLNRYSPQKVYDEVKKFDPARVFISVDRYVQDEEARAQQFSELHRHISFFKEKGLETGVWLWAFMMTKGPFTCIKSLKGAPFYENMCPLDEDFLQFAENYVKELAKAGADIIMYDDDFRYGFLGDAPGCICKNHLKYIGELLGEEVNEELIREKVYLGGPNKYRDAYLRANGDAFRSFAKRMRGALDEISPSTRMGACSCLNSWDIDGVSAEESARLFAGDTKPFFRLIGAPYWAALKNWGNSLQDVIELSRMECAWTEDKNIEIFSEGDAFPRPRIFTPASFLEGFDTALRVAGCTDGILKYGIDYTSDPTYEQGYTRFHIKNRELYKELDNAFADKESVGVRVYEYPQKLREAVFKEEENIDNMFFSLCARTLSYNSIPTVYEGRGITGAVFGENARQLDPVALEKGLILDIKACEILAQRGIDTGVLSFGEKITAGSFEFFPESANRINTMSAKIMDITLSDSAVILSLTKKDDREIPLSFRYENKKGQRFFVLNIIPDINNPALLRHYERNRQYIESIPWLSGKALPVTISGHPALYMQCKENDKGLSCGLWNFFEDCITEPEISLEGEYSHIKFINCKGTLCKNKVVISEIPPFAFAGFTVSKN